MNIFTITSFFAFLIKVICAIPENSINFTIALKQQNTQLLEDYLLEISDVESPMYGQTIEDPSFINKIVAPSEKDRNSVKQWIKNYNINVLSDNYDSLVCNGEFKNVEELFNVKLVKLNFGTNKRFMSMSNYQIPEHLSNIIEFVEGVTYKYYPRSQVNVKGDDNVDNRYSGKEVVARLYNITDLLSIQNDVSLASIEYQG